MSETKLILPNTFEDKNNRLLGKKIISTLLCFSSGIPAGHQEQDQKAKINECLSTSSTC